MSWRDDLFFDRTLTIEGKRCRINAAGNRRRYRFAMMKMNLLLFVVVIDLCLMALRVFGKFPQMLFFGLIFWVACFFLIHFVTEVFLRFLGNKDKKLWLRIQFGEEIKAVFRKEGECGQEKRSDSD